MTDSRPIARDYQDFYRKPQDFGTSFGACSMGRPRTPVGVCQHMATHRASCDTSWPQWPEARYGILII